MSLLQDKKDYCREYIIGLINEYNKNNKDYLESIGLDRIFIRNIRLKFELSGYCYGICEYEGFSSNGRYMFTININEWHMLNSKLSDLNDTLSHELAHVITDTINLKLNRFLTSKPHCDLWRKICIELGGNGERSSDVELPLVKKKRVFAYKYGENDTMILSVREHNKLVRGQANYFYNIKKGDSVKVYRNTPYVEYVFNKGDFYNENKVVYYEK